MYILLYVLCIIYYSPYIPIPPPTSILTRTRTEGVEKSDAFAQNSL